MHYHQKNKDGNNELFVVKDVSFELSQGEILGIVGESGAGKSTVGHALLSLLKEGGGSDGSIIFDNKPIETLSEEETRYMKGNEIGVIPQDPFSALNPILTIEAHFKETLKKGNRYESTTFEQVVGDALKEVNLPADKGFLSSYSFQISGGQSQRVIIALALLLRPKMLIADEPTTALDVSVQDQILNLISTLMHKYHMSMIIITHNMGVVYKIAHRIIVMNKARIEEEQDPQSLFSTPKSEYTRFLIKALPPVNKTVERLFSIQDKEKEKKPTPPFLLQNVQSLTHTREKEVILECKHIQFSVAVPKKIFSYERMKNLVHRIPVKKHERSESQDTALEIPHTHAYKHIINNVSFHIERGKTLGLIGESGSGKSSIAKMIVGLNKRSRGVWYKGRELSVHEIVPEIQMVFQSPYSSLNPRKTLKFIFTEALKIHDPTLSKETIHKRCLELMDMIRMESSGLAKYPNSFSGGQQQRICVARALALQPEFLLCDEPTSALDISVQADILNLLKELQKELNLSMLFISHDLPVVRYMCSEIAVLKEGKIMEIQEREALFNTPKHDYTKKLIELIPNIPSTET